jgi:hypothetical protein
MRSKVSTATQGTLLFATMACASIVSITTHARSAPSSDAVQTPVVTAPPASERRREFVRTGNDERDAMQVRSDFMARVSPEVAECFAKADAGSRALIFSRTVSIVWLLSAGYDVPEEFFDALCTESSELMPKQGKRALKGLLAQKFKEQVRQLVRELTLTRIPVPVEALAGLTIKEGPKAVLSPDAQSEAGVVERLQSAQAIVHEFLGAEEAKTFMDDPPMVQAHKTLRAGVALLQDLKWPNVWMLHNSLGGGPHPLLAQKLGSEEYVKLLQTWQKMTPEQQGDAMRHTEIELWNIGIRAASGEITQEDWLGSIEEKVSGVRRVRLPQDPNQVVQYALGKDAASRVANAAGDASAKPGFSSKQTFTGALLLHYALTRLPVMLF